MSDTIKIRTGMIPGPKIRTGMIPGPAGLGLPLSEADARYANNTEFGELEVRVGTLMDSSTARVATMAELLALPEPPQPAVVIVEAYAFQGDQGGGEFVFVIGDQSANVTSDPFRGVWASGGSGSAGAWARQFNGGAQLTPSCFGADVYGVSECAANLNAFFAAVSATLFPASCQGTFNVGSKITIGPSEGFIVTRSIHFNCAINSSFSSDDEILVFTRCAFAAFTGSVSVFGGGGTTYSTRTNMDGVRFGLYNGLAVMPSFYCRYLKRYGVNHGEHNDELVIPRIVGIYCGTAFRGPGFGITSAISGRTDAGTSNSFTQRSTLAVSSGIPSALDIYTMLTIDSIPYTVMAFDAGAGTVTVFPWLPPDVTSGNIIWAIGAAYRVIGSDANISNVTMVSSTYCGVGYRSMSLFPGNINQLHCAVNNIDVAIGAPNHSSAGGTIANMYNESVYNIHVVACSLAIQGAVIANAPEITFEQCYTLGPSNGKGVNSPLTFPITIGTGGDLWKQHSINNNNISGNDRHLQISPGWGNAARSIWADTKTVTLVEKPSANRLYGLDTAAVYAVGTGVNGNPTGTWTFAADEGYTVNGGSSFVHSGMQYPTLFICYLTVATKAWRVTPLQSGNSYDLSTSYESPATGFSLTIGAGVGELILTETTQTAAGTVILPAAPSDGQIISIVSVTGITAFTLSPNTSQAIAGTPPTTLPANGGVQYKYQLSSTTWYPTL